MVVDAEAEKLKGLPLYPLVIRHAMRVLGKVGLRHSDRMEY